MTQKEKVLKELLEKLETIQENYKEILEYEDYLETGLKFLIQDTESALDDEEDNPDQNYGTYEYDDSDDKWNDRTCKE